ncbi:MAG: LTA synthase family protein [Planctomycetes bacterium]|nr:LTA synthase family protein [Planctomycetota bacterium]
MPIPARRACVQLIAVLILTAVGVGVGLRVALAALVVERLAGLEIAIGLLRGGADDLLVALMLTTPILVVWALGAERWLRRPGPRAVLIGTFAALVVFGAFVEFFYFEEFDARFNNIALDYVLFPHEVVGNVFESYNVPLFVSLAAAAGLAIAWVTRGQVALAPEFKRSWKARLGSASLSVAASFAGLAALLALPRDNFQSREANEFAANGVVQLFRAWWSAGLDYELYYRTLPGPEAHERAARALGLAPDAPPGALQKEFVPSQSRRTPEQVVIVLEESLGSDYVGSSGHAKSPCTPELDRWMPQGLALTNLIANGNRTVRGLEGVLCSFVPLPGDSIVKRDKSQDVACVANVFRKAGFATAFYYGGYGLFDSMKPFMLANGYEQFVEQPDYPSGAFSTIWGVADEYIFDALVARQLEQRESHAPFFATLLSVSNHKPYRVPPGRPGFSADSPSRKGAVHYADWCLGRYLDTLRSNGLLESTLVLVVGDHGARVYGSEAIPIRSYRIPALFVGAGVTPNGERLERLCSQVDLVPTLLDLCGVRARASFVGQSLLGLPADGGRAFVHHNRDIGMVLDHSMVVLGLRKSMTFARRSGRESDEFAPAGDDESLRALGDDATAVFQTAYENYEARRLSIGAVSVSH